MRSVRHILFAAAMACLSALALPASSATMVVSGPVAGPAAGTYDAVLADFGAQVAASGQVMPVVTSGPAAIPQGCAPLNTANRLAVTGRVALMTMGGCAPTLQALNAQAAGAVAVLLVNDAPVGLPPLPGVEPSISLAVYGIDKAAGDALSARLVFRSRTASGVNVNLSP